MCSRQLIHLLCRYIYWFVRLEGTAPLFLVSHSRSWNADTRFHSTRADGRFQSTWPDTQRHPAFRQIRVNTRKQFDFPLESESHEESFLLLPSHVTADVSAVFSVMPPDIDASAASVMVRICPVSRRLSPMSFHPRAVRTAITIHPHQFDGIGGSRRRSAPTGRSTGRGWRSSVGTCAISATLEITGWCPCRRQSRSAAGSYAGKMDFTNPFFRKACRFSWVCSEDKFSVLIGHHGNASRLTICHRDGGPRAGGKRDTLHIAKRKSASIVAVEDTVQESSDIVLDSTGENIAGLQPNQITFGQVPQSSYNPDQGYCAESFHGFGPFRPAFWGKEGHEKAPFPVLTSGS